MPTRTLTVASKKSPAEIDPSMRSFFVWNTVSGARLTTTRSSLLENHVPKALRRSYSTGVTAIPCPVPCRFGWPFLSVTQRVGWFEYSWPLSLPL
jgi:hypothetical protein